MSNLDYERGRQDARLDGFDARHVENINRFTVVEAKQDAMDKKLDGIIEAFAIVKGGARMLYGVGVFGATIGAAMSSLIHWIIGRHS